MAVKSVTAEDLAGIAAARIESASEPKAEVTEPVTSPETDAVADPPKEKKHNRVQDRIDELTREKRELEEFAEGEYQARMQLQTRVSELETQVKAPKAEAPVEDKKPDRTTYTDQDKYESDLLAWNRREARREFQVEQDKAKQEQRQREAQEALKARTEVAKADIPDFDEVIQKAAKSTESVPAHIQAAIMESDFGPQLAYHLAKDPKERARVFGLSPAKALLAMGVIEQKYAGKSDSTSAVTSKTTTTKAPEPMPSLNGGQGEVKPDLSQPLSFGEYKRRRLEEVRARRR